MDKQAYLEDIYIKAFEDELEKIFGILPTRRTPVKMVRMLTSKGRQINRAESELERAINFPENFRKARSFARRHPYWWPSYKEFKRTLGTIERKAVPINIAAQGINTTLASTVHPGFIAMPTATIMNTAMAGPGLARATVKAPWKKIMSGAYSAKSLPHAAY